MDKSREVESDLVKKLKKQGLSAVASLYTKDFPEKLAELSIKCARGQYLDLKIIPAEYILNDGYSFERPVLHIAYARLSAEERKLGYPILLESIIGPSGFDMWTL